MSKLIALFALLLANDRYYSLSELTNLEIFGSKSSVSNLIRKLENSGFAGITTIIKDKQLYIRLKKPQKMPDMSINAKGLQQLALCRELLFNFLPKKMHCDMQAALSQASCHTSNGGAVLPAKIGADLSKGHINYEPYLEIIDKITQAIIENKVCSISYKSPSNKNEKQFYFAPKRLVAFHECLYTQGFFVTLENDAVVLKYADSTRLAIHRMKNCEVLEKSGEEIMDITEISNGAFGVYQKEDPFTVKIRFIKEASIYIAEREWSIDQSIETHKDGSITLTLQANNAPECISWILSFGSKAKILSPRWLKKELIATIEDLNKVYGVNASPNKGKDA